ncbi:homeobox protein TGIF2LX-like [Cloeon dipterum]|uniref:homeobox protein TGIF2LX-like n=1 Tax=Cloeon dipterum TaxID=197152 RepID=UPI00322024EA
MGKTRNKQTTRAGASKKESVSPSSVQVPIEDAVRTVKRRSNLPKDAIIVMNNWLRQNLKHAYPTDAMKEHMAKSTGLTLVQVSNWFINARRRYLAQLIAEAGLDESETHKIRRRGKNQLREPAKPVTDRKLPAKFRTTSTSSTGSDSGCMENTHPIVMWHSSAESVPSSKPLIPTKNNGSKGFGMGCPELSHPFMMRPTDKLILHAHELLKEEDKKSMFYDMQLLSTVAMVVRAHSNNA